jgi:sulfate transport system ATP-binding protein
LARKPNILLLDEPFGALDTKVRRELRGALLEIHKQLKLTSIFVTHDHEEAFSLADRVVVLERGLVSQDDTPDTIRRAPANDFVRDFLR